MKRFVGGRGVEHLGANSRLLMIPEVTYGTPPGGNWRRVPFLSCNLGAEQPLLDADVIGLGGNRDPAAPFFDTVTLEGDVVVPVDLINIGHWLRLLLGASRSPSTRTAASPSRCMRSTWRWRRPRSRDRQASRRASSSARPSTPRRRG